MSFGIEPDVGERDVAYDIADNFLEDFVQFSRSNQVLNEEQACVVLMGAATGMMDSHDYYTSTIVTGASSSGKSHLLNNVVFAALQYADDVHDWVYELTGGSDQAGVNDPDIDDSRILYFHELQKIPDEMLEFVKTIAEDGQFRYGRSLADSDAQGGFRTEHIDRDPAPVTFSFADENEAAAGKDRELRTRTVEVKVDDTPEKNKAVHDMKWGGEHITLPDSDNEYIFTDPDLDHAVKAHLRDMPDGVDVLIPYGNDDFDGDDWRAADIVKPLFNFASTDSTRASAQLAGLTMGSAICNYHNRTAVCETCARVYSADEAQSTGYRCDDCDDADLYIVVAPQDVANVIACRETLLATTHDLTEKKFTVLDAILRKGTKANQSGTAYQATKQQVIEGIQEANIATLSKSEIESILTELDENLIINTTDNPEDRRENLYIYDGAEVFQAPAFDACHERFADVLDPIREQPIERTAEQQLERLNAKVSLDALTEHHDRGESLDDFADIELSTIERDVLERIERTMDGTTIPTDVMDANSLKVQHMVGDTPTAVDDGVIRPEREPELADDLDGVLSRTALGDTHDEAEASLVSMIEQFREQGLLDMDTNDDGSVDVTVTVP